MIQNLVNLEADNLANLTKKWNALKSKSDTLEKQIISQSAITLDNLQTLKTEIKSEKEALVALSNSEQYSKLLETHSKIKRLQMANQYLSILQKLHDLQKKINHELSSSNIHEAIEIYLLYFTILDPFKIKDIPSLELLQNCFGSYELHLEKTVKVSHHDLKTMLDTNLTNLLNDMNWPKSPNTSDSYKIAFEECFLPFLKLKAPSQLTNSSSDSVVMLDAFQSLFKSFFIRFNFHFRGKKPTNQIDKPEYYTSFLLNVIKEQQIFLELFVQSILDDHNIQLSALPATFLHTIMEISKFDNYIKENLLYVQRDGSEWVGCVGKLIQNSLLFSKWNEIESTDSLSKLDEILSSESAWLPLLKDFSDDKEKVTESANLFQLLFESLIDRYQLLSLDISTQFFNDIMLPLLMQYIQSIETVHKEFQNRFYPINTKSQKFKDMLQIIGCINSTQYIIGLLRDWSNEDLFINILGSKQQDHSESLFEDIILSFNNLKTALIQTIAQEIHTSIQDSALDYLDIPDWTGFWDENDTRDLFNSLQKLKSTSELLEQIAQKSRAELMNEICVRLDADIFNFILSKLFGLSGVKRLNHDLNWIAKTLNVNMKSQFPKSFDAILILSLPLKSDTGTSMTDLIESLESDMDLLDTLGIRLSVEQVKHTLVRFKLGGLF
ncbi:TIP-1 family-domain-containing protein [Globomyces pollinis-pini]|nr:TIP-1 family-domain-containing protein [Globomyces pollinis-pini]